MTIQKRNKRKRGKINHLPPPLEIKDIPFAPMDKMVRNYPRICPRCRRGGYSTMCGCGGLTIINKGGING